MEHCRWCGSYIKKKLTTEEYTITFKNYDGSILETINVLEGAMPTCSIAPTRASDSEYNYLFNGWTPNIVIASSDAIYTATYTSSLIDTPTFFDDFDNVSSSNWEILNRKWGAGNDGLYNDGVIYQNVSYTSDGYLVLKANGDYYSGELEGIERNDGKRVGSTITSIESFGPGSFEVSAKILPRFGATSAFWTFFYDDGGNINHEIDIELNVEDSFNAAWFTNWLAETNSISETYMSEFAHNDGNFHVYRFDWHTGDNPRIEYYIDGILCHTATTKIPTYAMRFNIGLWFPNNWAGNPNFETDYMLVDYFKYHKWEGEPYDETPNGEASPSNYYPTSPIVLEASNLISNGHMNSNLGYIEEEGTVSFDGTMHLDGIVKQVITGVVPEDILTLNVEVLSGTGDIKVIMYDRNNVTLETLELVFNSNNEELVIELVNNVNYLDIIIEGNDLEIDNLSLK